MRSPAALAVLALSIGCSSPPSRGGGSPEPESEPAPSPVSARLLADVSRVGPGQEFTVGVELDIDEGWYVHWKHPGDGGEPTRVALDPPEGLHPGEPRFPGPSRFDTRGGEVRFGYGDRALVSIPIVAADEIAATDIELAAEVAWMACQDDHCEAGRATPRISLPVATPDAPSQPANQEAFETHRERLPAALDDLDGVTTSWQPAGEDRAELAIEIADASELAFFPEGDIGLVGQAVTPAEGGMALRLWLEGNPGGRARGVIRMTRGGQTRYASVSLEIPPPHNDDDGDELR